MEASEGIMIKVAFVDCMQGSPKQGGADIATYELYRHLTNKGLDVSLFSYKSGIDLALPGFIKQKPLLRELSAFPIAGRKAIRLAERENDIIHLNSLALAPLFDSDRPVVATVHNIQTQKFEQSFKGRRYGLLYNPITRMPFQLLERRAVTNIDHFIAVTGDLDRFLQDEFKVPHTRISRIPNGVDTEMFHPVERRIRRVIFVGRATLPKGFDILLQAAPLINAPILVITNKMRSKTAEMARARGIEVLHNVPHQEVAAAMAASRLLILPSWDEEQPLVVLEAMASGLPVVTTPAGASDLVRDGENGIVTAPGDHRSLAAGVNRLLEDREMSRKMGARNRLVAERRYAWERIADEVTAIYERIIRAPEGG